VRLGEPYNQLAERLRQALTEAKVTPAELARRLHLTDRAISGWLHATRRIKLEDLAEIAVLVGKEVTWFLGKDVALYDIESVIDADTNITVAERRALKETYRAFRDRRRGQI